MRDARAVGAITAAEHRRRTRRNVRRTVGPRPRRTLRQRSHAACAVRLQRVAAGSARRRRLSVRADAALYRPPGVERLNVDVCGTAVRLGRWIGRGQEASVDFVRFDFTWNDGKRCTYSTQVRHCK